MADKNLVRYVTLKCLIDGGGRNKQGGSEFFDKPGEIGITMTGWNFCNFLLNAGEVFAIPKQGLVIVLKTFIKISNFKRKISIKISVI